MSLDSTIHVLLVEDDGPVREAFTQGLEIEGFTVDGFDNAPAALRKLVAEYEGETGASTQVIVSDIRLPRMDGLEFFERVKTLDPELPVIFTTGHGDVAMAVEAMKDGAADFFTKPYSSAALFESIHRAAEKRALVIENRKLRRELQSELSKRHIRQTLGSSKQAERLDRMIAEIAAAEIDLMIIGESGTGKNFTARQIHDFGPRQTRPFITIDAGIVAHEDAELLIFGRDPNNGPGGGLSRSGLVEKAHGGTLFLDEIEAMPSPIQARLLSLVENRTVLPIGADRPRPVNIRVISATSALAGPKGARHAPAEPLLNRLSGITITLPSLRERRDDIPEIFRFFVTQYERELEIKASAIGEVEWHHLTSHDWRGNLRELRDFARNFVLGLSQFSQISIPKNSAHHSSSGAPNTNDNSLKNMVSRFESAILEDALRHHDGRVMHVASALKMQRKTLYDKLSKYGLTPADYRAGNSD